MTTDPVKPASAGSVTFVFFVSAAIATVIDKSDLVSERMEGIAYAIALALTTAQFRAFRQTNQLKKATGAVAIALEVLGWITVASFAWPMVSLFINYYLG